MRTTGFVIVGVFVGGFAGLIGAYAAIILLFDVLGLLYHGGDGMSGFAALIFFAPVGMLVGAVIGAIWIARRARNNVVLPAAGVFVIVTILVSAALLVLE